MFSSKKKKKLGASSAEWLESAAHRAHKKMVSGSKPTDPGYIYVIKMVSSPSQYIKIGFAKNPKERLGILQSGNPFQLEIVETWYVDNKKTAEGSAHGVMADYILTSLRKNTEWFSLPTGGLEDVDVLITKVLGDKGKEVYSSSWAY